MIKVIKLAEPKKLQQEGQKWAKEYADLKNKGVADKDIPATLKYRYKEPEFKKVIVEETKGKCAYCEKKITPAFPGDVEHMKPKSKFPAEYVTWKNLTLSCSKCNNEGEKSTLGSK